MIDEFKLETPKKIRIDEFVCLRSKMCSCKCGRGRKNKFNGVSKSQSKHIDFEEYKNSLDGKNIKNNVINMF